MVGCRSEMFAGMPEVDDLGFGRQGLQEGPIVGGAVGDSDDPGVVEGNRAAGGLAPVGLGTAAIGVTDAVQRLGAEGVSQRSCMVRARRCRVLTHGVMPPIFAKNAASSRGVR